MEKRAFLAVVLSILVFMGFQYFAEKNMPPQEVTQTATENTPTASEKDINSEDISGKEGTAADKLTLDQNIAEKIITIDTGKAEIKLTNRGGRIASILLNDYKNKDGSKLELIHATSEEDYPLLINYASEALNKRINNSNYALGDLTKENIVLSPNDSKVTASFSYKDKSGVVVNKTYSFSYGDYMFDSSVSILDTQNTFGEVTGDIIWNTSLTSGPKTKYIYTGPTMMADGKLITKTPKNEGEAKLYEEKLEWIAMQDKYFMAALIPVNEGAIGVAKTITKESQEIALRLKTGRGETANIRVYVGPRHEATLKRYHDLSLHKIINYGWFDFIAKPLFWVLVNINSYVHNYGVAIIILTILIKLVFYRLSDKGFASMHRMQKLQPHIKMLQERYKNDKTALNAETMKLYKEHKVNPMGGCLPTVIQIPVFFGLYKVLLSAIELRHAPFFFWITDLSMKDPYYITPVLMGITMFFQQKMTPSPTGGDSSQAKIMLLMPVVMTFLFLKFPAGLILYWMVNNILTIAQQYYVQRKMSR
ncbi:MAG: membrane protein insertase YidC [Nitrospinota bacterium]|nr:membrane protein insertase YidC [Nitrospinota bacterium]